QGWGAITGVVAYDSNYESVAGKVRLDVTVNDQVSLWVMGGYGSDGKLNDVNTVPNPVVGLPPLVVGSPAGGRGFYKQWGGNWAVWGGGTYKFNEKTRFNAQISYD
ncbi:porin, partial [Mesorhizobium sp. 98Argb]